MDGMYVDTERLKLIPVTRELWLAVLAQENDDIYTCSPEWPTEEISKLIPLYLDQLDNDPELLGWGFWVIVLKSNGLIVGDIGFKGMPNEKGEVEIGYGITPSHRNKGYAAEAARGLIEWGFSHEQVKKIKAGCFPDNLPSIKVLEKLGMRAIGRDGQLIYWELDNDTAKIGLKRGVVKLNPYCNDWRDFFQKERELLWTLLDGDAVDIQHIGSTAVPGLAAKPIIDIMVGVRVLDHGLKHIDALKSQGYEFKGEAGIPGRLFFAKGRPNFRTHHLHMVEYGSEFWVNHLLFRDYLIQHSDAAKEYERIKRELAIKYRYDREAYTNGKGEFIQGILKRARE